MHAKGRARLHGAVKKGISLLDADAHLRNGTRAAEGHEGHERDGRKLKIWASSCFYLPTWGQPLKRNIVLPKIILCFAINSFLTWTSAGLGLLQVADQIRALGSLGYANGTRRHPPSTRARSRHRDERTAGQHPTRRTLMIPARHHLRVCAVVSPDQVRK